ncbi:MAG: TCR/Tet family MFS transporter [Chitinophagaceae bacterium]|jgi:DHA1 family tetracycline resistance protein-like MFS transporter
MVNRKAAIGFIFVTLLIDVMGWGLIIPVMPKLIAELKGISVNEASPYGAWLISVYSLVQFVFAPLIGNLSDRYGRRPVLLFSLLGFGIDYLFLALAPNYGWLFVGRIIAGITGASFTTAAAYIADVSTAETRAKNFGLIGAAFGIGFIIGPALGGLLADFGTRAPFYAAASLCLLNCLYGYFILPESLSKENRRSFSWSRANPIGSLLFLKKHRAVFGLSLSFFLIYLAAQAVQANWNFFTMDQFQWSEKMVGLSLGVVGLLVGAVQGGLTRVVNPRLGNEKSTYLGLFFYALGLIIMAFAGQTWVLFVSLIPYCLGGIAGPSLQSIMAGYVPPSQQGELQGALTSLMSLTMIIGPGLMNNLYYHFAKPDAPVHFPGIHFLLGGILMLGSIWVAWLVFRRKHPVPEQAAMPDELAAPVSH